MNKIYWELYENGEVTEEAISILSSSCDIANDNTHSALNYFEILSRNFTMNTIEYYLWFKNLTFVGPWVKRMLI